MKTKLFSVFSAMLLALTAVTAHADVTTDAHGNTGYDTAAECDAAVQEGVAKFYQPFTHHKPLLQKGEKGVQVARIRDLGPEYEKGACDLGVGRKFNRDGVSVALQGKYIPYSPDMPINAYTDETGAVVRVTMAQCDNWFSGNAPRPISFTKQAVAQAEPPVAPEPVVETPVVEPVAKTAAVITPYVFGTLGALHDGVRVDANTVTPSKKGVNETDTRFAGQAGLGVQINNWLGGEIFYQGARKHSYEESICAKNRTFGARATIGKNVSENTRLFLKAGAAGVRHTDSTLLGRGKTVVRPTAGIGATYNLNEHLALRADYDHYFKRSNAKKADNMGARWKGANYLGAGLQYNF